MATLTNPAGHARTLRTAGKRVKALRNRLRSNPSTRLVYRVGVFVAGLLFVVTGIGLAVLPGPLTIPPLLLGLWIWSTEFRWAHNLFSSFRRRGQAAWRQARARPANAAMITGGGLVLGVGAVLAVKEFQLVDSISGLVGLAG